MEEPMDAPRLILRDLGKIAYDDGLDLQRTLQAELIEERARTGAPARSGYILLLEHDPPVVTVTRRKDASSHVVGTQEQLNERGIELRETDRGGDVTWHGPGQLVVYVIVDINRLGLGVHGFMRLLEESVIGTLRHAGLNAMRDPAATGVWVGWNGGATGRKICALGVRFSRYVSMHGLALNVSPDLSHYSMIVPCGLHGREVTSIHKECGDRAPSMSIVKAWMGQSLIGMCEIAAENAGPEPRFSQQSD